MSVPTIAFFNNKSGVGKTSMVYHLSWMLAERGLRIVADADLGSAVRSVDICRANPELGICQESYHVSRILGIEDQGARLEIQAVYVKEASIPQVEFDQKFIREMRILGREFGSHTLKGCVIADIAGFQVHAIEVPVLIAVGVLIVD